MPARQVPKNYCGLSGEITPKRDQGVFPEDSLQKDLITLLEFDQRVISFEGQPVQIPFEGANGKVQIYTPDFRVSYYFLYESDPVTTCLVEVQEREELRRHWADSRNAYKAAIRFAMARGWKFKILTDREISIPDLPVCAGLTAFAKRGKFESNPWLKGLALESLAAQARVLPKVPIDLILSDQSVQEQLAQHERSKYELFGQLFLLVLSGKIAVDPNTVDPIYPFKSELWIPEPSNKPLFVSLKLPGLWRM
jgi:hypothetical protein